MASVREGLEAFAAELFDGFSVRINDGGDRRMACGVLAGGGRLGGVDGHVTGAVGGRGPTPVDPLSPHPRGHWV